MKTLTPCNTITFLLSLLIAFAVLPAFAATPADFAGTWSCTWNMVFDSTVSIVAGDKIDVTNTWKYSRVWGVDDGEAKTEGTMTTDGKLQFGFKYAPTNASTTKITLSSNSDGRAGPEK